MPKRSNILKRKKAPSTLLLITLGGVVLSLALILTIHALQQQQETREWAVTAAPSSVLTVEQTILDNIKQNGFDANTPGGGLYVNWRYGTSPLQTNFNGSGTPYPGGLGTNHDPLTDIRYIHNLWLYKSQHPTDTQYDSEIARYTPIIKAEWANATNERGWLFDEEFMDTYNASKDSFYQTVAMSLATGFAKAIKPGVGIMYKTSATDLQGYYTTANVLEAGCALIQAGTIFNNPSWTTLGQTALNFVYSHAYISQYHTFAQDMDQVLTASGSVNPNETFYIAPYRNETIQGNEMRTGDMAQMILSLLFTYKTTHNQDYLLKAEDLLNALSLPANPLGMWDNTNLGYLEGVLFSGASPQLPGAPTLISGKKEAGRQVTLLWAFHLANQLTNNKYQIMESNMLQVALAKAYYASGHGVLYEMNANWAPLNFSNGQLNDAVTTEAMGAELEGLLSLGTTPSLPSVTIPQTPTMTIVPSPTMTTPPTSTPSLPLPTFHCIVPGGCGKGTPTQTPTPTPIENTPTPSPSTVIPSQPITVSPSQSNQSPTPSKQTKNTTSGFLLEIIKHLISLIAELLALIGHIVK